MAKFLIQSDKNTLEFEEMIVRELLRDTKHVHESKDAYFSELDGITEKGLIPVGTIQFVTKYLQNAYGFEKENPIEIPEYLRTEEFLKRNYSIVAAEDIPRTGTFFLKDVSELKKFGQVITADYFITDEMFDDAPRDRFDLSFTFPKDHLYQVSDIFDIKSEYRVYVIDGEIECIAHYNGDATLLPDVNLIKKAVALITLNEKWLKSYTIDVMVGPKGSAIIEIHNFASVGLYSTIWDTDLLYAYVDSINYLINDNKAILPDRK